MSSVIEDFFVCPSEALLESCTKEQLVQIDRTLQCRSYFSRKEAEGNYCDYFEAVTC